MTLGRPELLKAADAELLTAARAGDSEAFGVLYERHVAAARRVAFQLAPAPGLADEVAAEAFGRMLDVVVRGGGPSIAARPYALTAVRQVCYERLNAARGQLPADMGSLPGPDQFLVDPAVAGLENALIARAYQSLPERSRAVLWHTEIELDSPADVAPLLGLTRNGVAALRRRAADDLRQAYLQLHISLITQPACRPVAERLGAFDRRSLSARDAALVSEHLARCEGCQVVHRELTDIMASVRGVIAPLVLGPAAAGYVADARIRAAAATGGPLGTASQTVGTGAPARMPQARDTAPLVVPEAAPLPDAQDRPPRRAHRRALWRPPRRSRPLRRSRRVAAAIAVGAVLATTTGIALAITLPGNGKAPASAGQLPPAPSLHAAATQPPPAPSQTPSPSPSPSPSPPPAAPAVAPIQLTASLSVFGHDTFVRVAFQVGNAGSTASGSLTAVIALPAGAAVSGSDSQHTGDQNNGSADGTADPFTGGWSCQPSSGGAICTHGALAAGQQTTGMLSITMSGSAACGQPVRLTVSSGGATAGAAQSISC